MSGEFLLIYDGECSACVDFAHWAARRGRVRPLPNQTPGLAAGHGLSRQQVDQKMWLIEPDGRALSGAAAANRLLTLMGGGWGVLALPSRLRAAMDLEERLYGWVASRRCAPWLQAVARWARSSTGSTPTSSASCSRNPSTSTGSTH